jgi:hydroxyacylglutathione hydrolase
LLDESPPEPLSVEEVLAAVDGGAVILDTRPVEEAARGTFDGAINVAIDGRFAEYTGGVVDPHASIVIIAEPGRQTEAKVRLGRIGFDTVVGHLRTPTGELADHPQIARTASRLTTAGLTERIEAVDDLQMVDIRGRGEQEEGMIDNASSIPLPELRDRVDELDPARPTVVYCAGGHRSAIARSWMTGVGFEDVSDLIGGYTAWTTTGPD